jgi:hypothetical protein
MRRLLVNVNNQEIQPTEKKCGAWQHFHCDQMAHLSAAYRALANHSWLHSPYFVVNDQTFDRNVNKHASLLLREKLSICYHHAACFRRVLQPLRLIIDCYKIWCEHSVPWGYPIILVLTHVNSNNNMVGTLNLCVGSYTKTKLTKLHGLSPRTNYTYRAAAAGRRS